MEKTSDIIENRRKKLAELRSQNINGVLTEGVLDKNIRIYNILNKSYPAIAKYLADPLQFYADTSIVIPRDINGLDS